MSEKITLEKKLTIEKTFTTSPKTRRHGSYGISGSRARDFMQSLWLKGLRKCHYQTLVFEFVNFFESNDSRLVEKYLGRLREVKRYPGVSVVRMNIQAGKNAHFRYVNERELERKRGLMEVLGYLSITKNEVTLHHERMNYFTVQTNLESGRSSSRDECGNVAIDDSCASGLCGEVGVDREATERHAGEDSEREKKEEDIDCTHTNLLSAKVIPELSREEESPLVAEPSNRCADCGLADGSAGKVRERCMKEISKLTEYSRQ